MLKKNTSRFLSIILSLALVFTLPSMTVFAEKELDDVKTVAAQTRNVTGREQVNFNRDWKFVRSDVKDAQDVSLDDTEWVDIAIPHNFSIPYEMTSSFYVGYGWYRKTFDVPSDWDGKKVELEFEGVFQVAEIYVNGQEVGSHRGGYSGFVFDITDYLNPGAKNLVAVRVNNIWQSDLAPRGGDHQFTGGIYRDVYLNVTEDVHVTWYGTFVTTPDLTNPAFQEGAGAVNIDLSSFPSESEIKANIAAKKSNVRVQTEVQNDGNAAREIVVKHIVKDEDGKKVGEFQSEKVTLAAGEMKNIDALSQQISGIELWGPDNPYLYSIESSVMAGSTVMDTYESSFGFRWVQYKNDGFYINGEKTLLNGANVHQDHAGWSDAVTHEGFYRDVKMLKDCGMNFARGSHYPHDTSFAEACDKLGVMFWSECNFWGMGGCSGKDDPAAMTSADWFKDAYPQDPNDEEAFEESLMDSLEAMIRVNRNHPSIINWSMGNEVFFTADATQQKAKNLVNKMRNKAHELDPTRKAGMGGVQREGYDKIEICDIAGYNGDGGRLFENTWMPNVVAEYGSKTADRPGEFRPFYDKIQNGNDVENYVLKGGSAGLTLWCAFHHGTIGGDGLAKMGMIDYYRLPLKSWYWYRNKYMGIPLEESVSGTAASMEITASDMEITNDGKKDTQLIVTMKDASGNWVNDNRNVTLTVTDGPGIFPGGKSYTFVPNYSIRDGKASIEFRSFYAGTTTITASADGLPDAEIAITTKDVLGVASEIEPENFYDASMWGSQTSKIDEPMLYGDNKATGRPLEVSSNTEGAPLAADGDMTTSWVASKAGSGESFQVFLEWQVYAYKIKLGFDKAPYPYKLEVRDSAAAGDDEWITIADYTKDTIKNRPVEEALDGMKINYVRITFNDVPENQYAFLSEIEIYGNESGLAPQYAAKSVYLSDVVNFDTVTTGWGQKVPNKTCEENPLTLGGKVYKKGFGLHADSTITYNLDERYSRISGVAGIDDETNGSGDAIFQIYADDVLIYDKNLVGGQKDEFNLSISGVQWLRLVTDANGADSNDHTDWADVKLHGAIRDTTVKGSGFKTSYVGMTSQLEAGEEFIAILNLENTQDEARELKAAISLYDAKGNMVDYTMQQVKVGANKKVLGYEITMQMPRNVEGCRGKLNIWDADTLVQAGKPVYIESSQESVPGPIEGEIIWGEMVDGEDTLLEKVGNWQLWPESSAYAGTETFIGDTGNPVQEGDSVSYAFTGNYVRVGAKKDGSQAGADVYIDNVKVGTINNKVTGSENSYDVVWTSESLEKGEHTIKLVPLGKFGLDYFQAGSEWEKEIVDSGEDDLTEAEELLAAIDKVLIWIEQEIADHYTLTSRKTVAEALENGYEVYQKKEIASYEMSAQSIGAALSALTEKTLTSIKLNSTNAKIKYTLGDKFSTEGLLVTAVYNDDSQIDLSSDVYTVKGYDAKVLGSQVITVSYQGKTATYIITVAADAAVAQVERLIDTIGTVTYKDACKVRIDAARKAYENLTKEQKASVTNYTKLTAAETKYKELEKNAVSKKKKVPAKGSKHKKNGIWYKVLKSSATKGTVTAMKPTSKNVTKVKIPASVKLNGYVFKVTEISSKAFLNKTKLKRVTIGANVTKIGKKAFYGDEKLKNVVIKSKKLRTVGRNAFGKIAGNVKVKVPANKVNSYKNKLKNKGLSKKAKIVK